MGLINIILAMVAAYLLVALISYRIKVCKYNGWTLAFTWYSLAPSSIKDGFGLLFPAWSTVRNQVGALFLKAFMKIAHTETLCCGCRTVKFYQRSWFQLFVPCDRHWDHAGHFVPKIDWNSGRSFGGRVNMVVYRATMVGKTWPLWAVQSKGGISFWVEDEFSGYRPIQKSVEGQFYPLALWALKTYQSPREIPTCSKCGARTSFQTLKETKGVCNSCAMDDAADCDLNCARCDRPCSTQR